ncbi:MAG TPA: AMP-binding protein, partial [Anaeromyxobacteraceae bacterium]|nr:AMP-binding protein [Anaeromyxobacteraceae bacterium]
RAPRWGAPRLSALADRLAEGLDEVESRLAQSQALFELYLPFIWDNKYVFRCANVRDLYARLADADRERIPWDPERLDWRHYWLDVHLKGLEEWVFPGLEEESKKKVHAPRPHRDLLELLEAAAENHGRRTALRMSGQRKERFSYAELRRLAGRVASFLASCGTGKGERVLLVSENRPEWAIAWFGIAFAGGVAVPVDHQLSAAEVANLARSAGARVLLLSEEVRERLDDLEAALGAAGLSPRLALLSEALQGGPAAPPARAAGPDDVASLIFTSGTTGTPKGVLLTHRNFASLVARLAGVFDLGPGDGLLSVLPLHHTFEFTCGLLVPLSRGAEVEYLDELTADTLGDALEEGRVTALIGVPALWALLHRRITQELAAGPGAVEAAFAQLRRLNAALRDRWSLNLGKLLFWPVHRKLGGRLRILVSGGSALSPEVQQAFHEMGFDLYEGYGLTEAAPVLSVSAPDDRGPRLGNVGKALPGIEIRIADPDERGVGEVLARGPNVMLGYFGGGEGAPEVDRELTGAVLRDGWLHTGDLGTLDAQGRLTIVGRRKEVIIDGSGKNVYPDEVEELYQAPGLVKELSVVGLPEEGGEKVAMLAVPDYQGRDRGEVRRLVDEHLRRVSAALPFYKRAKLWHLTDQDLPRTAARKVKRRLVVEELRRLEAAAHRGRQVREAAVRGGDAWVLDLVAGVAGRPRAEVTPQTHLATELAFDSLMAAELMAALEQAGVPTSLAEQVTGVQTAGELARLVAHAVHREAAAPGPAAPRAEERPARLELPGAVAALGRAVLSLAQRTLYRDVYRAVVEGAVHIPRDRNFLVVANHQSHLDMGLAKVALGEAGDKLAALAAADYFFDTPLKRAYFENFTNLIPMDREGSIRKSLRAAAESLRRGFNLLIFPEGTRSLDGRMAPFKPTAGYLALTCGVDVLPVYLRGTHQALPKGALIPRRGDLEVLIGQAIPVEALRRHTAGLPRGEAHKEATRIMEDAVKALRDRMPSPSGRGHSDSEGTPEGEGARPSATPRARRKDRT